MCFNCKVSDQGEPDKTEIIEPQRGLRQGDPLSPYLFLICAEGFFAMLHDAEMRRSIRGIKICREAPSISHLLFADDSLLLMEANVESAHELNRILNTYEASSGQMRQIYNTIQCKHKARAKGGNEKYFTNFLGRSFLKIPRCPILCGQV